MDWGKGDRGARGVLVRRLWVESLVCVLVVATVGGCGTSSDDAIPRAPVSVAAISPAELSEPGPFGVGITSVSLPQVSGVAYYPGANPGAEAVRDAEPDASTAPYPVVLGNLNMAAVVGEHLASHGFVFLGLMSPLTTEEVDGAVAFTALLDGVADDVEHPFAEIADTDHAGVMGYSGESLFALMLAGARIDPDYHAAVCADPPRRWGERFLDLACSEQWWDTIVEQADLAGITTSDGLWATQADPRIKASMPMGPRGFYLTGVDGLAAATTPILLVVGGEDTERLMETAEILDAYPNGLAEAVTLVGADHAMIFEPDVQAVVRRLAVAFLTQHLKDNDQYAEVLTPEFINRSAETPDEHPTFDQMMWGVPAGSGY